MGSLITLLSLSFLASSVLAGSSSCKCTPDSSCWPSGSDWAALNTTLNGALIRGVPPGSVCYPSQPNYNKAACQVALARWFDSTWHAENPISIDYPIWVNNSCNPIYPNGTAVTGEVGAGARGCTIGNYPWYAVAATTPAHVSAAFQWAAQKNIRVVIKNTGHNYPGRNTGYGSLSIWTHNIKGVEFINDFKPTSCPFNGKLMAARIGAGAVGSEIRAEADANGAVVVTGGNPDTGAVGWVTGGGHGLLSSDYGMGADNLLEVTIVTPNGTLVTANPCQNSDLYFASRGGGGSTFGVIMSAVLRAYPTPQTTVYSFAFSLLQPSQTDQFWDMVGFIHSQMPKLKAGGMAGYYSISGPPYYYTNGFEWTFYLFDKPSGTVETLMQPIVSRIQKQPQLFTLAQSLNQFPTYLAATASIANEGVGYSGGAYGSHLLSKESLSDANRNAALFKKIGASVDGSKPNAPLENPLILGHLIASNNVPDYYPLVESMTPTWRDTTTHIIVVENWPVGSSQAGIAATYNDITNVKVAAMRAFSPTTGAYFNEPDSFEPNWQSAFWGPNYPALAAAKKKYDPNGLLWCSQCVGSDAWTLGSDEKLCRSGR